MRLDDEKQNIDALKFATEAYAVVGGSPATLLIEAAQWLLDCYKILDDRFCLLAAGEITRAYMEMGIHDKDEAVFDEILSCLGTTRKKEFPQRFYPQHRIKLSASHIREVLGYWPKSKENNAEWVARDIEEKVRNQIKGCWYYERGVSGAVFELLVLEDASYLLDLEKRKVYYIENLERMSNDTDCNL